jgi:hypothetical protein
MLLFVPEVLQALLVRLYESLLLFEGVLHNLNRLFRFLSLLCEHLKLLMNRSLDALYRR